MNTAEKTLLAVDAGGTKTRTVRLTEAGQVLAESLDGPGNLVLSYEEAEASVVAGLRKTASADCIGVVIGAAGAMSQPEAAERLAERVREMFDGQLPVYVIGDGNLAAYAALGEADGIIVVSGTGSVLLGKRQDTWYRSGGWGHLLGETGGGASIGLAFLRYLFDGIDAGEMDTAAWELVSSVYNVENIPSLVKAVYDASKAQTGALVVGIAQLAGQGHTFSASLLRSEGEALAEKTVSLYRRMALQNGTIAISGSCIRKTVLFRDTWLQAVREKLPDAVLMTNEFDPVAGAWPFFRHVRQHSQTEA